MGNTTSKKFDEPARFASSKHGLVEKTHANGKSKPDSDIVVRIPNSSAEMARINKRIIEMQASDETVLGGFVRLETFDEKKRIAESHARQLVVKFDETVDGGYLAPYGCYAFDKLDYDTIVVKKFIVDRKLAPFYTPLQDYSDSWDTQKLLKAVRSLPLHEEFAGDLEEFEGIPVGDLKDNNLDKLIDLSNPMTRSEMLRMRSTIFRARLYKKRIIWQNLENERLFKQKLLNNSEVFASDALIKEMYKEVTECPICFLEFPKYINKTRCCSQPICTECFIQVKRSKPFFPHDENDHNHTHDSSSPDVNEDPTLLTSQPAKCPFCNTEDFAVVYSPPETWRTGINGVLPGNYTVLPNDEVHQQKQDLIPITSDTIRPGWQDLLLKERFKLLRRSVLATELYQQRYRAKN